ncbi:MAG: GlcNAc-transferase family protein [Achromobacter sp.]|uniref:GlcNAc-transferase family protein n=1 Tax=Achromobacter sp. TaxID=134375 RepID=UPI003D0566DC
MVPPTIFVQIASYRDPELVPTIQDLVQRAQFPQRLRIVVSWQHGPEETLGIFFLQGFLRWQLHPATPFCLHTFDYGGARVELIDIPHERSQGACWARNMIQQRYGDETYTLQLDSHHRFVAHWDTQLIDMLEQLRADGDKPLLTAYLPPYSPVAPHPETQGAAPPLGMRFDRFIPEGPIFFRAFELPDWAELKKPVPARFYSGHFTFADGSFAREVQHDPDYFFHGEEISLAVRAFTHGYDLYHPHRSLAWHEYTREGRPKIWDDHDSQARDTGQVPEAWWERNERSLARNRALFGMNSAPSCADSSPETTHDGNYGFGAARTLSDYESYAGISFQLRAVQPEVIACRPPGLNTEPCDTDTWRSTLRRSHDLNITAHSSIMDVQSCPLATHCRVSALREDASIIYEETLDIDTARASCTGEWFNRRLIFFSDLTEHPAAYRLTILGPNDEVLHQFEQTILG